MTYYRDIDYFLYFCDFPHMGIPGAITPNSDGTVTIYINTLYTTERQERALRHELRHLVYHHFWCDTKTIEEKEYEANAEDNSVRFADDYSFVEYIPPNVCPASEQVPNKFTGRLPQTLGQALPRIS